MSFVRKTYAPEIGDAIVSRIETELGDELGLKICQQGGLEWMFAPEDLDTILPCVLVQFNGARQSGEAKLNSRVYTYTYRVRLCLPLADSMDNPRALVAGLRDIHDLFIAGQYRLTVSGTEPESFGFQDCQGLEYGLDPDLMELIGVGAMVGTVEVVVRASADPFVA